MRSRRTQKLFILKSFGKPNSDVVDIEALAKIAHKHKIPLVVDNTFATPYLVIPIDTAQISLFIRNKIHRWPRNYYWWCDCRER